MLLLFLECVLFTDLQNKLDIMFLLGPKGSAILILICFLCFILHNQISKLYKVDHRAIINFFPVFARPIMSPTNNQFIWP